ncbi:hypothetical protein CO172_00540 [Candidatus Uhrbacteria bacterium CG_4_9_14_3_um_filter_36_7]|uniref:Uncharacterized protein n=1 Tax=Candidatus Uhrbacteria bacterium CG_4_9_14_3_um_filter_36_7 TaxID=1975033 RepID=A0A2M7XIA2_9BACT|nr:MAG: hypothetical protein CO172_00540 [Candidatus Uhrbacteria bacterium CG_4_9_14_3_um_filter_36_7]
MLLYGREVGRDEEMIGELTAFNHGFVVLDTTVAGVTSEVFRPLSGLIKKLTNGDIFLHSIVLPNYVFFHIYTPGSREAKLFPGYPVLCYWQVGSGHGEVYGRFGIEAARWNGEDGLKAWFDRWLP